MFDLAIHGRVPAEGAGERWVYIKGGKIVKVSRERAGKADAAILLSGSQFLMPAATDLHVHLRDWKQARKETVETGTKSALAGGVTTVADMPNTEPKIDSKETMRDRVELLREKSFVDFAVHAGVPRLLSEIAGMKRAGAFAVKLYPPELVRFPEVLKEATKSGMKVVVHAEEYQMTSTGASSYAEEVAVAKVLGEVDRSSEVRFAHLSTAQGVSQLVKARSSHRKLTAEVTPHHLFMSESVAEGRIGLTTRVNPSLRSSNNSARMRRLMRHGAFDFYATDHAPHTIQEKFEGSPGFPGLELALPLFLTKTRDIGLASKLYCEAPAAYLGMSKGRIAPGYEADIVVVGRREWKVDPEKFVSKGRVTPFAGEVMQYTVDHVFKSGSTVYHQGRFSRATPKLVAHGQTSWKR